MRGAIVWHGSENNIQRAYWNINLIFNETQHQSLWLLVGINSSNSQ